VTGTKTYDDVGTEIMYDDGTLKAMLDETDDGTLLD
jgi:hypothetical protein